MTADVAGDVVRGYRIVRTLGRGGLGTTFEATREATRERVALKRLAVADVDAWKRIELFEREARVLLQLDHPAIPRYVEHFTVEGRDGPTLYIAQELVVGRSLAEILHANGLPMDEAEVRRIADELLSVLDYLGRQVLPVIHRDIKPENVLRRQDGTIALVDFGAARAGIARPEGGSTTVGTYGYMAPEQLHGVATPATDIYGLACTLLFLLTGRSPTELPRRKLQIDFQAHARVTAPFAQWLRRALEPAPEDRFLSASSARSSLRKLPANGGAPIAFGASTRPPTRPLTWALLGTLILAIASLGTVLALDRVHKLTAGAREVVGTSGASNPGELPARWKTDRHLPPLTLVRWFTAHMSAVFSVATSPSDDRILSGSNDGTVKIWDMKTGNALRSLAGHTGRVGGVAWSADGALVGSAGPTSVLVHDAATGATRLTLDGGGDQATSVDFSPDDTRIAAGYLSGAARVWALDTGALLHTFANGGRLLAVRFSPDGRWLATGGDNQAQVWATDSAAHFVLSGHAGPVDSLAWAPDGRILATAGDDHALRLWVAIKGIEVRRASDATNELWAAAFDPRGKYVATVGKEGLVRVYDAMTLRQVRSRLVEKTGALSLAWVRDGNSLVLGDGAGRVQVLAVEVASQVDKVPAVPTDAPEVLKSTSPSEAIYARAMALVEAYNGRRTALDQAEQILRDASSKDPNDALLLVGLGRIALHRGYLQGEEHTKESLSATDEWISRALARSPQLAEAHLERGWVDYFRHDEVRAKDEALLADRLTPSGGSQILLANLAYRANDLDEAERHALRAIPLQTRSQLSGSYTVLQEVYFARGDGEAEGRAYERELELDPEGAWTRGNYANFLLRHEEYDRAVEAAQAALKLMDYPAAHRTLAEAYSEKGAQALWESQDPGVAKTAFDNAVVADPRFAHGHYGLGAYFRQLSVRQRDAGLLARSNAELERAAKLDEDPVLALSARAENDRLSALVHSP